MSEQLSAEDLIVKQAELIENMKGQLFSLAGVIVLHVGLEAAQALPAVQEARKVVKKAEALQ